MLESWWKIFIDDIRRNSILIQFRQREDDEIKYDVNTANTCTLFWILLTRFFQILTRLVRYHRSMKSTHHRSREAREKNFIDSSMSNLKNLSTTIWRRDVSRTSLLDIIIVLFIWVLLLIDADREHHAQFESILKDISKIKSLYERDLRIHEARSRCSRVIWRFERAWCLSVLTRFSFAFVYCRRLFSFSNRRIASFTSYALQRHRREEQRRQRRQVAVSRSRS